MAPTYRKRYKKRRTRKEQLQMRILMIIIAVILLGSILGIIHKVKQERRSRRCLTAAGILQIKNTLTRDRN